MSEVAVRSCAFGAFGKMPGLGDFFRAGLPRAFVEPWDTWLQETIVALRETMGEAWQNAYLSAPIWRFTLSPGLMGPDAFLGVMMASIDRVGRQFPLTLGTPISGSISSILDHTTATATFRELEGIALGALEDDMTRERLAAQLDRVAFDPPTSQTWVRFRPDTMVARDAGHFGPVPDIAATMLHERFKQPSVWSADVPGGMRVMTCEGLPGPVQARGLIDMGAPIWQDPS